MAGGTFVAMNKVRPGAYINFESVPKPLMTVADRGIVTMPVAMEWGPNDKLITLLSEDLLNGNPLLRLDMMRLTRNLWYFVKLLKMLIKRIFTARILAAKSDGYH